MNQQLLQHIYLNYQPKQFYTQYLKNNKIRPDGRNFHDHRPLRMSVSSSILKNSITASRGSTIVIAELSTKIQRVIYNPISKNYGKPLLDVNVSSQYPGNSSRSNKAERSMARSLQKYVSDFIDWNKIQQELVFNQPQKGQSYAHTGTILIRIADSDGCIQETILLAVQTLLWTSVFGNLQQAVLGKKQISKCTKYGLKLCQFYYPIKYVQILSQLLIDPTRTEQQSSAYQIVLISNLLSNTKLDPLKVIKVHNSNSMNQKIINQIQKLYIIEVQKLKFDIKIIQQKCITSTQNCYNFTVNIQDS